VKLIIIVYFRGEKKTEKLIKLRKSEKKIIEKTEL
jgi:hypothetical protein